MRKHEWLLIFIILWLAAGLRAYRLFVLGGQADEGVHTLLITQLTEGAHLYTDLFESRTPGVFWLLALLGQLIPANLFIWRWLTWGMGLITIAGLWTLGRLLTRSIWGGAIAALLFTLAPLPILWGRHLMLEPYVTAATALAMIAAIQAARQRSWSAAFLSGLFIGLAVLAKQSAVVVLPALALFWLTLRPRNWSHRGKLLFSWGMGGLIVLFLLFVGLLTTSAVDPFLATLSGAERLAPFENLSPKWHTVIEIGRQRPLAPLALAGVLGLLWQRPFGTTLLSTWLLAELVALWLPPELDLQPGGFSHYTLPAIAALATVTATGLVWGWRTLSRRGRWPIALLLATVTLFTLPGWWRTLTQVTWQATYPQPTQTAEQTIGRAAAALTTPADPILVLGNSILYHWAERFPDNYFFHYPAYFTTSDLGATADGEIASLLTNHTVPLVIVSRMHLEERLSPAVLDPLWSHWTPVERFSYPYQRDLFLFLPQASPPAGSAVTDFVDGIHLRAATAYPLPQAHALLVQLTWQADETPPTSYTVFVHLLDDSGRLLTQDDALPTAGWRPTTSWSPGEPITDWHWLPLEQPLPPTAQLAIGLYDSQTGRRLPLSTETQDSFITPLIDVTESWNNN